MKLEKLQERNLLAQADRQKQRMEERNQLTDSQSSDSVSLSDYLKTLK